jgi:hypothetical protein
MTVKMKEAGADCVGVPVIDALLVSDETVNCKPYDAKVLGVRLVFQVKGVVPPEVCI